MKRTMKTMGLAATALVLSSGLWTQTAPVDRGQELYRGYCATCHGLVGKGDGPMAGFITKSPTNLTQLSKNNQGVFPINRLYQSIEGGEVAAHGTRDMPVWGREFGKDLAAYYVDVDYDAKALIRGRILLLLEYINRLQTP